ncbi:hypothetical protein [Streptomyces carpaticus]|uniref:Aminoglycoside phosphotransferase domain-containing protein n=1 Tax=Streptomyces carpaticus TaxID=285558 RepID=A0ABV4ZK13_9ACTN
MWPQPDAPEVVEQMRTAHRQARTALNLHPGPITKEIWGWHGRTLSGPVHTTTGTAWLRLARASTEQKIATFWDGNIAAEESIPASIPRPRLRMWHDWTAGPWKYRAELYDYVSDIPASPAPIITTEPDLPRSWWASLKGALNNITTTPTRRVTIHQSFLDRAMPHYLGTPINTTAPSWSTAHGDLHFANVTAPKLLLLDWEGWGLAPTAYDIATLHTYSLLVPSVTARIRHEFADLLGTPAGHFAELAVITELLHTNNSGILATSVRTRSTQLLNRSIPCNPNAAAEQAAT